MRYLLLCLFFFLSIFAVTAQRNISGIVLDEKNKTPLPFATIILGKQSGSITNAEGEFEIEIAQNQTSLSISYIGYDTKTVAIAPDTKYLTISLAPSVESLDEVVLYSKENPALAIIRNVIANKKNNSPEKALNSFKFNSYNKLLVTANPDSINGAIDSVYTRKNGELVFKEVDSSNYNLKKDMLRNHIYVTEKVSEMVFNTSKGKREKILASRMAGFQEPIYELLGVKIQSFSFYENTYSLFGTSYAGPIANNALNTYNYKILDTIQNGSHQAYMIYYHPKKKGKTSGLQGVLYIDTKSYALQKGIAEIKAVIDIKAVQNFEYQDEYNIWFPSSKQIKIEKGESSEAISLFGSAIKVSEGQTKDSLTTRTNPQDSSDLIYLISNTKNSNIAINETIDIKGRGLAIEVDDNAHKRDEAYWESFRTDSLTTRGKETYVVLDSIIKEEKVEKNIALARKLLKGYYPTKYVDIDLRYLLKYNNYEAFRVGLGGITNSNFSNIYQLNGYGVYGTKDRDFKFGFGGAARLDKRTNTWFGLSYMDDLIETGSSQFITDKRAFSLFEPRLFNIDLLHKTKRISANIEHQITAKTHGNLQISQSKIRPTYPYAFQNDDTTFENFTVSELTFALQWNPFSEYMQTRHGRTEVKAGYPKFTAQISQSIDGLFEGDFNFTKIDFRAVHQIKPLEKGTTTFLVKGGLGFGDIPITHLYHVSPNNPNKDVLLQRFSIAGRDSFETMYFNEFFSDKYAMFQAKHEFKPFKIFRKFQPRLLLISRYAIGDTKNTENHLIQEFKSLKHGYLESGFELNNLFKGFGLSFMYRYGAYHLPKFEDNLSFKFTYYFSLGF